MRIRSGYSVYKKSISPNLHSGRKMSKFLLGMTICISIMGGHSNCGGWWKANESSTYQFTIKRDNHGKTIRRRKE